VNQPSGARDPSEIATREIVDSCLDDLHRHMRLFYPVEPNIGSGFSRKTDPAPKFDERWAPDTIEALALRAYKFMLPTRYVKLVDDSLLPYTLRLNDKYRCELAVSLVLQLFVVARGTFTDLERGWRRVQVMEIALDSQARGIDCGVDPRRSFGEAVRFARKSRRQLLGPILWKKIEELSVRCGYDLEVKATEAEGEDED
jgi:hypothetical protein